MMERCNPFHFFPQQHANRLRFPVTSNTSESTPEKICCEVIARVFDDYDENDSNIKCNLLYPP